MINERPVSWDKSEELEMLFFFYQIADEMLSEVSADTYALQQHSTITLFFEMAEIYNIIDRYNLYDEFYKNYITPIIDEFLDSVEDDYLLKHTLGDRLQSIKTGFVEAKKNHVLLKRWMDIFMQSCTFPQYIEVYKTEIKRLVTETKDKTKLYYCAKNFFSSIVFAGYSREYIYTTTKRFFQNQKNTILTVNQISDFIEIFDCERRNYEFLVLMNTDILDYIDNLSESIKLNRTMEKVDIKTIEKQAGTNSAMLNIIQQYRRLKADESSHEKICIVKYIVNSLDPYSAAIDFQQQIRFLQTFTRYFKHHLYSKQVYKFLLYEKEGYYRELKIPNKLRKRPFVAQPIIDARIRNIISSKAMNDSAYISIVQAIDMHSEAFDAHSIVTLLRTFWTALETLFANSSPCKTRESVIESVTHIVQKTYILKLLRQVYNQLLSAIGENLLSTIGISSFEQFVEYFSSYKADSAEMKKIYSFLSDNPLLRTRLFELRTKLKDGYSIKQALDKHQVKINRQLTRLYRIRNIATHLGQETSGLEIVINHLHNYFDFAVNYMLCKSENDDYIVSTYALVLEAKNDNLIHNEMIKTEELLSKENYMKFLFGPDPKMIHYSFE